MTDRYPRADAELDVIIAAAQRWAKRLEVACRGELPITREPFQAEIAAIDKAVDYLRDFRLSELAECVVFRRDEIADQPERTPERYPGELEHLDRLAEHLGDRKVLR